MEKISLDFVIDAVSGVLIGEYKDTRFSSISTDTRNIPRDCLFIALQGENFDGNDFLDEAFEKGAVACLAQRCDDNPKGVVVIVNDTRSALLKLAGAYRELFNIPVVGITGSVGKTSTKEMVYAVLSKRFNTHKNEGNLNNEVGMPLSVFYLNKSHEAAVFEMGMSGLGEISRLTKVASPSIGIITNIGISHIEKLGSQQNILKAKLELLDGLKTNGTLILNQDDELLSKIKIPPNINILGYGINNRNCEAFADDIVSDEDGTSFDVSFGGKTYPARLSVCGRHNVYNALAAFLSAVTLGMSPKEAITGFLNYATSGLRQKIVKFEGIILIEDCYNASPDSMNSAFEILATARVRGKRIAVLADMLELGESARQAHLEVGEAAMRCGVELLLTYGENARLYCEGFEHMGGKKGSYFHFEHKDELSAMLSGFMKEGDAVLFKGSRGMRLEEVIEKACEGWKH